MHINDLSTVKIMENYDEVVFKEEEIARDDGHGVEAAKWKILIVDDDEDVHEVTKMALNDFSFNSRELEIMSAYSGEEARRLINDNMDTALIFLDVVMETDDSGLRLIKYIRGELNNSLVRIVLRTGQAGHAPEREVIRNYDINDYKEKGELTSQKLFTAVISSLRSYEHLATIEDNKREIAGLYDDLKEYNANLERKVDTFGKFVPRPFLECLNIENFEDIRPEQARPMQLSIIFSDIRNFSNLAEKMSPQECFKFLNRYFTLMSGPVEAHNGFIDKFLGDGIMALFHCSVFDSVDAAIQMQVDLDKNNVELKKLNICPVKVGIGINTGDLILGTVGSDKRIDSTVIGDAVNLASRIESLTKYYNTRILVSEVTYLMLKNDNKYLVREIDYVRVYGKDKPVKIYEIFDGDDTQLKQRKTELLSVYNEGLASYKSQNWQQAIDAMSESLKIMPDDNVAQIYLERCKNFQTNQPGAEWDGAVFLDKM